MKRFLVCTGSDAEMGLPSGRGFKVTASRSMFEVIEGAEGFTPLELQETHITQEIAEKLVGMYPEHWQIVPARELAELERMVAL
jgi:hypothetical protein